MAHAGDFSRAVQRGLQFTPATGRANVMAQSGWYHDKAAQCDRMALESASAIMRDRHIRDRDNWRAIAARIDVAEETVRKRETNWGPSPIL